MVTTTAQLHSTKSELRFCAGSNPAHGASTIRNGKDLWQWSQMELRLPAFRWSTMPQNQFIIIIFIIIKANGNLNFFSFNFSLWLLYSLDMFWKFEKNLWINVQTVSNMYFFSNIFARSCRSCTIKIWQQNFVSVFWKSAIVLSKRGKIFFFFGIL